ncbi:hypothetical protein KIPB_004668 [Kipferlia bialata]|uniref:Mitochondrial carrier domain-containing protein n=1 Tax=Kipferlia bialata TaxID=797122 RepID=A0A9K3CVS4_9EUKA|nr:hypothetical protein KIPB_004668 [Kipferlia bialata]|eukprot:g4668.t1
MSQSVGAAGSRLPPGVHHGLLYPLLGDGPRAFIAGVISGMCSCAVMKPLDVVCRRYQAGVSVTKDPSMSPYTAYMDEKTSTVQRILETFDPIRAAKGIVTIGRTEGVSKLYEGLQPALIGSASAWGLFHLIHNYSTSLLHFPVAPALSSFLSSVSAAMLTNCIVAPLFVVKTRMEVRFKDSGVREGLVTTGRQIVQTEGVKGLYKGLPVFLLGTLSVGIRYTLLSSFSSILEARHGSGTIPAGEKFAASLAAKGISSVAFYPLQVIRIMQRASVQRLSIADCKSTLTKGGGMGLFSGIGLTGLKILPAAGIKDTIYGALF